MEKTEPDYKAEYFPLVKDYFKCDGMRKFIKESIEKRNQLERKLNISEIRSLKRKFSFLTLYHFVFYPRQLGEVCGDLHHNPEVFKK
ncbi:MAG: hypothetical protein ABIG69_19345 [Bacteroidota bacterium]